MAARFASSSAVLRPALAAHASFSAASLLRSALGPSELEPPPPSSSPDTTHHGQHYHLLQRPRTSSTQNFNSEETIAGFSAALPWLDRLHDLVADVYVGGLRNRCAVTVNNVLVQIGEKVSLENPLVSYYGAGEVERAFRGRMGMHPQNDVKTVLECVNVEASGDSICDGDASNQQHGQSRHSTLAGIPSQAYMPRVEVTYRLSQEYGPFFSVTSLVVVTVQVRRGCPSTMVRNITPGKVGVPLATSGFTPRAANTVAVAATSNSGAASAVLTRGLSKIVAATRRNSVSGSLSSGSGAPLVAEVVRIEERWNGVRLLQFAPFHWSRRLNGLVAAGAAYFLFS